MFISKFDIYDNAWLDLIFKDRNKSYGAYDLRKHYASNLFKAMGIAAAILAAVVLVIALPFKTQVIPVVSAEPTVVVDLSKPVQIDYEGTTDNTTATHHNTTVAHAVRQQVQQLPPPAQHDAPQNIPDIPEESPTHTITSVSAAPSVIDEPDAMPQPNGGNVGLAKFLKDNLQYPETAAQKGLSGRVWLSFIVEKDGRLSNIEVTQSAGNGFDEEALRVLKLAPVWQPGLQNGQPVRVRYTIPVNFQVIK